MHRVLQEVDLRTPAAGLHGGSARPSVVACVGTRREAIDMLRTNRSFRTFGLSATTLATLAAMLLATSAPANAAAPPDTLSPADGATVDDTMPWLGWNADPAVDRLLFEISSSNALDAGGEFPTWVLARAVPSDTIGARPLSAERLHAGRWYWHVATSAAGVNAWSPVSSFVVPLVVRPPRITGNLRANGLSGGNVVINSTGKAVRIRVRGWVGSRRCLDRSIAGTQVRSRLGTWYAGAGFYCRAEGALPPGTRIRIQATATSNGVARTTTRTFRTPTAAGEG
jgi:hypothetical protein